MEATEFNRRQENSSERRKRRADIWELWNAKKIMKEEK